MSTRPGAPLRSWARPSGAVGVAGAQGQPSLPTVGRCFMHICHLSLRAGTVTSRVWGGALGPGPWVSSPPHGSSPTAPTPSPLEHPASGPGPGSPGSEQLLWFVKSFFIQFREEGIFLCLGGEGPPSPSSPTPAHALSAASFSSVPSFLLSARIPVWGLRGWGLGLGGGPLRPRQAQATISGSGAGHAEPAP